MTAGATPGGSHAHCQIQQHLQIVLSHCSIEALYDGYGLRQRVGDERAAAVATDREFEMRRQRPWQQGQQIPFFV